MPKKRRSKRDTYVPPASPNPKASPKWVPYVGVGVIVLGTLMVIVGYVTALATAVALVGFVAMAAGLLVLSQWR